MEPQLLVAGEPEYSLVEEYDRRLDLSFVWLVAIVGAVLRALYLDRPTVGMDEALLYARSTLSFSELWATLRNEGMAAGGVPGFDLFYWGLGKIVPLNPWVLRAPVAIAGALLAPAMFSLASQIVTRRAAVLAALITACSAFVLGWSRQAQAALPLWLMMVCNVAALLWWLRRRSARAYLAWVASGVVMMGLGLAGTWILGLDLVIALTHPRRRARGLVLSRAAANDLVTARAAAELQEEAPTLWQRTATWLQMACLFVVGMGIIVSGVTAYRLLAVGGVEDALVKLVATTAEATTAPTTAEATTKTLTIAPAAIAPTARAPTVRSAERATAGAERATTQTTQDPLGDEAVSTSQRFQKAGTLFLMGWASPAPEERGKVDVRLRKYLEWGVELMLVALALGLVPWRVRQPLVRLRRPWELAVLGRTTYAYEKTPEGEVYPATLWRRVLWLGLWITVPTYAIYCAATENFSQPTEWWGALLDAFWQHVVTWLIVAGAIVSYGVFWTRKNHPLNWLDVRRVGMRIFQLALIAALVLGCCVAIARVVERTGMHEPWSMGAVGMVWPAMAIVAAVLLMRIRIKWVRPAAIALVLLVNLAQATAWVVINPEPRMDLVARDVAATQDAKAKERTYVSRTIERDLAEPVGQYYLAQSHASKAPRRIITTELQALRDVTRAPHVERIIVWDTVEDPIANEGILAKAAGWHVEGERRYQAEGHLDWQLTFTLRQRVFARKTATTHEAGDHDAAHEDAEELKRRLRELEDLTRQVERGRRREQR